MSRNFKDSQGHEWTIKLNFFSAERVAERCKVDLLAGDVEPLITDPVLLCRVVFVLLEEQIKAAGLEPEQFAERLVGDPIDAATEALLDAIADFFPSARRTLLQKSREKYRAMREKADQIIGQTLDDPRLEQEFETRVRQLGDSVLSSLASSASSPGGTR